MALELINIRVYNSSGAIDSSLSPSIAIYDNSDNSLDFSGVMSFNSTLGNYQFFPNIDATKTYTCSVDFGVSALTRFASFGIEATATTNVADIWNAQIGDYSNVIGSFGNKFSNYGGVSHVIEKVSGSALGEDEKKAIIGLAKAMEELKKKISELEKPTIQIVEREVVRIEKVSIPSTDSATIVEVLVHSLKEINSTLSTIMIKGLLEIKNNK